MKKEALLETQELARAGVLYAPASFLNASIEELAKISNGCGAAGDWFKPPATIYGTNIRAACNIHDFQYHYGKTIEDKWEIDRIFHNNLLRLIDRDCKKKWFKPRWLMGRRAKVYYLAVKQFGGPAFFAGKN